MHGTPKVGCFFKTFKIQCFCCFSTGLVRKLQQWSLYEVIENILLFVLNTKRRLSDIWLLWYKQKSFGCFWKKLEFQVCLNDQANQLLDSLLQENGYRNKSTSDRNIMSRNYELHHWIFLKLFSETDTIFMYITIRTSFSKTPVPSLLFQSHSKKLF